MLRYAAAVDTPRVYVCLLPRRATHMPRIRVATPLLTALRYAIMMALAMPWRRRLRLLPLMPPDYITPCPPLRCFDAITPL